MRKLVLVATLLLMTFISIQASAETITDGNLDVAVEESTICPNARSAILFEGKTNTLLYEQEMNLRLAPASMTKIMTLLLIYEAIEKEVVTKETIVTVSENAKSMEGSRAFLSVGEQISVDELIKCICIASANDAAVAMAEAISGSEESFVEKMNQKAKDLGLNNTLFSDCTGLSSKNHYTSAYDLAVMADCLIDHFPDVLKYTSLKEDYIRKDTDSPFWLVNTNKLLGRVKGIDGLKTGYTSFSGYCITLHMDRNNMSLISVVMGYTDSKIRNGESVKLLEYGANNYSLKTIYSKGDVLRSIHTILYKEKMNIMVQEDVNYLLKKGETLDITTDYEYTLGDVFEGKLTLYNQDRKIGQVALCLDVTPHKRNLFELMLAVLKNILLLNPE